MRSVAVTLFFLLSTQAYGLGWKDSLKQAKVIGPLQVKILVDTKDQVSCEHLEFRYSQIKSILSNLDWLITNGLENPSYHEVYDYIEDRAALNIRQLASQLQYEVTYNIPKTEAQAIGVIKSTDFEQLNLQYPSGKSSFFNMDGEGNMQFKTKVNAFDICEKQAVEVLFLSSCPVEVTSDMPCSISGACSSGYVADWQSCAEVKAVRVDLRSLQEALGKRTKVIKKVW